MCSQLSRGADYDELINEPYDIVRAPCAIQIIAPRFQDEKCVWAARIIDRDIWW
jgi:amidase